MDILNLYLRRLYRKPDYTIGKLYIGESYFSDVIEDKDRGLTQDMPLSEIKKIKVPGETAIPYGTYEITLTWSPKYKRMMLLVNDVPGYSGIRIHSGNTSNDTEGCLIPGKNTKKGVVTNSRYWTNKLYSIVEEALKHRRVFITITK